MELVSTREKYTFKNEVGSVEVKRNGNKKLVAIVVETSLGRLSLSANVARALKDSLNLLNLDDRCDVE